MDYFDLHCDTLYECLLQSASLRRNRLAVSVGEGRKFSRWCQTFAIWIPDGLPPGGSFALFKEALANAKKELDANRREISLCVTAGGMENALGQGRAAALLAVEGGRVLEGKLSYLDKIHRAGVRMLTLTWNGANAIAGGCQSAEGLTPFGRQVVERMNQLGMMVDLSHLNDRSFAGILPISRYPLASHTASRAVYNHPRNLTDAQFAALRDRGGLVGLCFYPAFLGEGEVYERFYLHLSHFLDLGGENCLAIGSDFDGADMARPLSGLEKVPRLWAYLLDKGLDEGLLRKIFWENGWRYVTNVLTKLPG
ncbi:MAG TPA: dipeptidase [Firmicutes bacterium]|nr:dipeptidase [Bacillota bacterium]